MLHKRRKAARMRGSKNYGWGKGAAHHKGSGSKGGKGRAGSGKRADQKKPSFWKDPQKVGFKVPGLKKRINAINLDRTLELINNGKLQAKEGIYDLGSLGFNKLVGKGPVTSKVKIKVEQASQNIIERVKSNGGEVIVEKIEEADEEKK